MHVDARLSQAESGERAFKSLLLKGSRSEGTSFHVAGMLCNVDNLLCGLRMQHSSMSPLLGSPHETLPLFSKEQLFIKAGCSEYFHAKPVRLQLQLLSFERNGLWHIVHVDVVSCGMLMTNVVSQLATQGASPDLWR